MGRIILTQSLLVAALAAPAAAQIGSLEDAMRQAEQYQRQYGAGAPAAVPPGANAPVPAAPGAIPGRPYAQELPDPVELSSSELSSFVSAVKGLKTLGIATQKDPAATGAGATAQAYATNAQALGVLQSNGFTPERFQQVAYTVGMALGALEMKGKEPDVDAAMAQLEADLTPEQYEMMRGQLGRANSALEKMKNQPAKNLDLVGARRQELDDVLSE